MLPPVTAWGSSVRYVVPASSRLRTAFDSCDDVERSWQELHLDRRVRWLPSSDWTITICSVFLLKGVGQELWKPPTTTLPTRRSCPARWLLWIASLGP